MGDEGSVGQRHIVYHFFIRMCIREDQYVLLLKLPLLIRLDHKIVPLIIALHLGFSAEINTSNTIPEERTVIVHLKNIVETALCVDVQIHKTNLAKPLASHKLQRCRSTAPVPLLPWCSSKYYRPSNFGQEGPVRHCPRSECHHFRCLYKQQFGVVRRRCLCRLCRLCRHRRSWQGR